jgi:hypothetical protein
MHPGQYGDTDVYLLGADGKPGGEGSSQRPSATGKTSSAAIRFRNLPRG